MHQLFLNPRARAFLQQYARLTNTELAKINYKCKDKIPYTINESQHHDASSLIEENTWG